MTTQNILNSLNLTQALKQSTSASVTATGTDAGSAAVITTNIAIITGGAIDTGIRLTAPAQAGEQVHIYFNDNITRIKLYPQSGGKFGDFATDAFVSLGQASIGEPQAYRCTATSTTVWIVECMPTKANWGNFNVGGAQLGMYIGQHLKVRGEFSHTGTAYMSDIELNTLKFVLTGGGSLLKIPSADSLALRVQDGALNTYLTLDSLNLLISNNKPLVRFGTTITPLSGGQAGAALLTADDVSLTGGAANDGVRLPVAAAGRSFRITNNSGGTRRIYPAVGDTIGNGTDTFIAITNNEFLLIHYKTTNAWWYTTVPRYVTGTSYMSGDLLIYAGGPSNGSAVLTVGDATTGAKILIDSTTGSNTFQVKHGGFSVFNVNGASNVVAFGNDAVNNSSTVNNPGFITSGSLIAGGTADQPGADFTISTGSGKGSGTQPKLIFKAAPLGTTGTALNAPVTVLTLQAGDTGTEHSTFAGGLTVSGGFTASLDATTGNTHHFNGIEDHKSTAITAHAGGGSGSATGTGSSTVVHVTTCATDHDSIKLGFGNFAGQQQTIFNETQNICDIYATVTIDDIPSGTPIYLQPNSAMTFNTNNGVTTYRILSNGTNAPRTTSTATSYTVQTYDYYVGVTDFTATRTMTLPAVTNFKEGNSLVFKDEAGTCSPTNSLVLDGNASETIDGATTQTYTTPYVSVTIVMRNGQWFVI